MSADNDRLMHSGDPKHAKDGYDVNALLSGSTATLRSTRGRHSEAEPSASVVLSSALSAPTAPLRETEITAKIPVVQDPAPWQQQGGPAAPPSEGWAQHPMSAPAAIGEHRAVDTLAHVGVRSTVKLHSQRGWRGFLYRTTRINLGLSPDERYELELYARVRRNVRESHQIGVFGLKGGVGKTAVTVALGSMLSKVRGDRILAVDANPASGNLAFRTGRQSSASVTDLLAAKELSRYNDIRAYTSINEANLEVLPGPEYSAAPRAFNDADWIAATDVVSQHYNLVLADCAADMFHPAARGALATVSGVVIVASASIDGARQAAVTVDWMRQNGHQDLLSRACVVINHVGPGKPNIDVGDLVHQFQKQVPPGRVFVLPWDKHIAAGTEIHLDLLRPMFRRRILEIAAALSDDFDVIERG